jgi:hypothetical protein
MTTINQAPAQGTAEESTAGSHKVVFADPEPVTATPAAGLDVTIAAPAFSSPY